MHFGVAVECARLYALGAAASLAAAAVLAQPRDRSLPLWSLLHDPLCIAALCNALLCAWLCGALWTARRLLGGWSAAEGAHAAQRLVEWGWGRLLMLLALTTPAPQPRRLLLHLLYSALLAAPTALLTVSAERLKTLVEEVVEEGADAERRAAGRGAAAAAAGAALLLGASLLILFRLPLPEDLHFASLGTIFLECGIVVFHGLDVWHRSLGRGVGGLTRVVWLSGVALLLELLLALLAAGCWAARGGAGAVGGLAILAKARYTAWSLRELVAKHLAHETILNIVLKCYPLVQGEEDAICAICWSGLGSARRLPCGHVFHGVCLARWVVVAAHCPTCRRALPAPAAVPRALPLLHVDGSRFGDWLPSFRLEVVWTRVLRDLELPPAQVASIQAIPAALLEDDSDSSDAAPHDHAMPPAPPPRTTPASGRPPTPLSAPPPPAHQQNEEAEPSVEVVEPLEAGVFSAAAAERQQQLAARRKALLRAARQRFLQNHQ